MRELLVSIDASIWSQISATVFALMFVVLLVWVFIPARRAEYNRVEKLPLED